VNDTQSWITAISVAVIALAALLAMLGRLR
jgi:hypothetical protein